MFRRNKARLQTVKGHRLRAPALTPTAYRLIALYVILPFLGVLLALDLLLYAVFRYGLDRCYGLWCLWS